MPSLCSEFRFNDTVWIRNNGKHKGSRYFVNVDQGSSQAIQALAASKPRKWRGSVKVKATIGFVSRETSIFPDKKSGTYLLPLKSAIRKELRIEEWSKVLVSLSLID